MKLILQYCYHIIKLTYIICHTNIMYMWHKLHFRSIVISLYNKIYLFLLVIHDDSCFDISNWLQYCADLYEPFKNATFNRQLKIKFTLYISYSPFCENDYLIFSTYSKSLLVYVSDALTSLSKQLIKYISDSFLFVCRYIIYF